MNTTQFPVQSHQPSEEHTVELRYSSLRLPDSFFATLQLVEVILRNVMTNSFPELAK
jgi:hypothetical protein